jgi:uncharacterized protein
MDFLVISLVSACVAALTLVSGFGLGTLLLPAFAVFFPIEIAIAATGIVHLVNNLFRVAIVGKWADRRVVVRFGIPAILAAFVGASLMTYMADVQPLHVYEIGRVKAEMTWLKLVIAALLAMFAGLELWPCYQSLSFSPKVLPIGGALSGFFGGISGLQGALRAPFLLRAGLKQQSYVGTASVISTIVDLARLAVYGIGFAWIAQRENDGRDGYAALTERRTLLLVGAACLAGFCGSYFGAKVVKKVTLRAIRTVVAVLLFVAAAALAAGLV